VFAQSRSNAMIISLLSQRDHCAKSLRFSKLRTSSNGGTSLRLALPRNVTQQDRRSETSNRPVDSHCERGIIQRTKIGKYVSAYHISIHDGFVYACASFYHPYGHRCKARPGLMATLYVDLFDFRTWEVLSEFLSFS
jgi:hypothetical protein